MPLKPNLVPRAFSLAWVKLGKRPWERGCLKPLIAYSQLLEWNVRSENIGWRCQFKILTNLTKLMQSLPGHCHVLQFSVCWLGPWQVRPPYLGAGLEHVRVLFFLPPPQIAEQTDHLLHDPQLPSTIGQVNHKVKHIRWCSSLPYGTT